MKHILLLAIMINSLVSFSQEFLNIYYNGQIVHIRSVANIDSIVFGENPDILTDIEGNAYNTVQIGTRTWMAENLRTTKYNDGTDIIHGEEDDVWNYQWENPMYCWVQNDIYSKELGALYNAAVIETGKICPTGWHVPTMSDVESLQNFPIDLSVPRFNPTSLLIRDTSGFTWDWAVWRMSNGYIIVHRDIDTQGNEFVTRDTAADHGMPIRCVKD